MNISVDAIMERLKSLGATSYKKTLLRHGVQEPVFGVKIEELKRIQKIVKKDYRLALELYDTGVYDAQYLAGLIADEAKMTKKDLRRWLATGNCLAVCGSALAAVAAESKHGWELSLEWIGSTKENVAATGWNTLSNLVGIKDDAELDLARLKKLLQQIEKEIHGAPNLVRYSMNSFMIAVGTYVESLTAQAKKSADSVGLVSVDMGDTACKVPYAPDYIKKIEKRGSIGKKRRSARC